MLKINWEWFKTLRGPLFYKQTIGRELLLEAQYVNTLRPAEIVPRGPEPKSGPPVGTISAGRRLLPAL